LLQYADGAVVGSSLKVDGITWNPVDQARVRELMDAVVAATS
jgi:predicted TIM-barrel enzyme